MSLTAAELRAQYSVDESELDKSIKGIPGKIKSSAAALAGAGLIIGAALGGGLMSGMENERAVDRVAASLALTGPAAERAGNVAGQLFAGAYAGSVGEASEAVEAVISSIAGMRDASERDLMTVSRQASDFASIFGVDVTSAANAAGLAITNGLAKDGTEAFDLLTASLQQVPKEMREGVLDASNEYAGFFSALGIDGPNAFGMLVAAAKTGEQGLDKAGDVLKEFSLNSIDLGKNGEVYKQLGLDAEEMANGILAGGDVAGSAMQQIVTALLGMKNPSEQAAAAISLFGTPLEDMGVTNIPAFLGSLKAGEGGLQDFAGAIDKAGGAAGDNASTNLQSFMNTAKLAFVDVLGGQVLPVVTSVASTLATTFGPAVSAVGGFLTGTLVPALQSTAQWIANNQTPLLIVAGIIAAVFLPHLIMLGVQSLIAGAKSVAGWLLTQAGALAAAAVHSLVIVEMVAGWVLMGAQSLIQGARMAAAWVLAMGPVGWVIAAVIALVALIVANWDTVVSWTKTAWEAVVGAVSAAWEWIKGAVKTGIDFLVNLFLNFTGPGLIIKHWETIKSTFSNGVNAAVGFVRDLPGKVIGFFANAGSWLADAGKNLLQGLWNGISGAASWLKGKVMNWAGSILPGWVKDILGIHSPSTVFAEIGRYLMLGMGAGIDAEAKTAVNAAARAAAAVTGAMQVSAPDLMGLANGQAMAGLTARRPPGVGGSTAGASGGQAGVSGGVDKLLNIENYYEQPGSSPASTAAALGVEVRTRPWT